MAEIEKDLEGAENTGAEVYIDELNRLKKDTVPKEKYKKLEEENAKLVRALADQDYSEKDEGGFDADEARKRVVELRNTIFGGKTKYRNDYEYFSDLSEFIKLKDQLGDSDLSEDERQLGELLEEVIAYADGDSSVFNVELQRRIGKVNINQKRR